MLTASQPIHFMECNWYVANKSFITEDSDILSEEEVFALDLDETPPKDKGESEVEDEDNDLSIDPYTQLSSSDSDADDLDTDTWGTSRKAYYNADKIQDLDEAREEEEEALRLQKKRINRMSEEDFIDDIWTADVSDQSQVVRTFADLVQSSSNSTTSLA